MKINWKVRFRNKAWLMTFICAVVAAVYQILGLLGVVIGVSQDQVEQFVSLGLNILAVLGVLIDPTTPGAGDSERAMRYTVPGGDSDEQ